MRTGIASFWWWVTLLTLRSSTKRVNYLLSVHHENSVRQVVSLTAVAIATGYVREDPVRITSAFFNGHSFRLSSFSSFSFFNETLIFHWSASEVHEGQVAVR
ncbi:hypothetical protein AVEN_74097-1 [Araneus ventricosus]|uniref:Secreted protein n=1 Tax=Araneus ventricosus TaxID=182803 RepID=A0A4Y2UQQ7_ARAVE|nr:hypothetical protein AVEN_241644-1 [Araneus ventricosus]GBO14493.1 hypothetical protein AVEN_74097-1 [Araneus ventricosus]